MSDDVSAKVKEYAKLVHFSNKISDFHLKNLKTYPFVFFEGVKSVKLDYDLSHRRVDDTPSDPKTQQEYYDEIAKAFKATSNSYVAYHLELDEQANGQFMDKRFQALEGAARRLFWSDLIVEIYFNGRIVFKSVKK